MSDVIIYEFDKSFMTVVTYNLICPVFSSCYKSVILRKSLLNVFLCKNKEEKMFSWTTRLE